MDAQVARAFEAVAVSVRRLRSHLRLGTITTVENGVRVVTASAPRWMLLDMIEASDHADHVRADQHLDEIKVRKLTPTTPLGWTLRLVHQRRKARKKVNLPRERFGLDNAKPPKINLKREKWPEGL